MGSECVSFWSLPSFLLRRKTLLTLKLQKLTDMSNRVDPDDVAHHEPTHLESGSTLFVLVYFNYQYDIA